MKIILTLTVIAGTLLLILTNCATNNRIAATAEMPSRSENASNPKPTDEGKRTPVIVELFTSEGCSSCPPADGNLSMLVETQPIAGAEIIALSEHVDYWNRLGWADPFSSAQFSGRQSEYSQRFKRDDVYTPQMVVDGNREFAGGNMREALKQIAESAREPKGDMVLEIAKETEDAFSVKVKIANLPKFTSGDTAIILLAVTEDKLTSNVARGENGGRELKHIAVTRYLQNIGNVNREDKTLSADIKLSKDWQRENLNLIAFVQEVESRKILGASRIGLKK